MTQNLVLASGSRIRANLLKGAAVQAMQNLCLGLRLSEFEPRSA